MRTSYPATLFLLLTSVALQILITVNPAIANVLAFRLDAGPFAALLGLITHMVAHANWAHLIGNFTFGLPALLFLEKKLGRERLLEFYLLCGLSSALLQMVVEGGGMIGSSGALFGIMMAACLKFGETKAEHALGLIYLAILLIPQVVMAPIGAMFGVAIYGHVGGALGSILLCTRTYNE